MGELILCCGLCQAKGDDFDELLLKPDDENYDFDDYFDIEWDTGWLVPNVLAPCENQRRAAVTIKLYRLNDNGKPDDRVAELESCTSTNQPYIDSCSYRFYVRRGFISSML
jgi:hypothetical protein